MKTLVMTVPNSGTHFLIKFLVTVLGLDGDSNAEYITAESNVDFAHVHPSTGVLEAGRIRWDIYDAVIITLRHPHRTIATAKVKGKANLIAGKGGLIDAWQQLIKQQERYQKAMFLVIDGDPKDHFKQLMVIAEHFGKQHLEKQIKEYADAWEPVNETLTEDDKQAIEFAVKVYEKWQS